MHCVALLGLIYIKKQNDFALQVFDCQQRHFLTTKLWLMENDAMLIFAGANLLTSRIIHCFAPLSWQMLANSFYYIVI